MVMSMDLAAKFGPSSRRLRLETLVKLRWVAVAGQLLTILVVALWFEFPLPLVTCLGLIAALAAANSLMSVAFPPTYRLEPAAAFAVLALDLFQVIFQIVDLRQTGFTVLRYAWAVCQA